VATLARSRKSASERQEDVIRAAIEEFACNGYHGGSTQRIADEAGISQAYVLRLFGTKKALFIAALERNCRDMIQIWDDTLGSPFKARITGTQRTVEERFGVLGESWIAFHEEDATLRMLLQALAAASDEEIRRRLSRELEDIHTWLRKRTDASFDEAQAFWGQLMMLMVGVAIGAHVTPHAAQWARSAIAIPGQSPTGEPVAATPEDSPPRAGMPAVPERASAAEAMKMSGYPSS